MLYLPFRIKIIGGCNFLSKSYSLKINKNLSCRKSSQLSQNIELFNDVKSIIAIVTWGEGGSANIYKQHDLSFVKY